MEQLPPLPFSAGGILKEAFSTRSSLKVSVGLPTFYPNGPTVWSGTRGVHNMAETHILFESSSGIRKYTPIFYQKEKQRWIPQPNLAES